MTSRLDDMEELIFDLIRKKPLPTLPYKVSELENLLEKSKKNEPGITTPNWIKKT